MIGKIFKEHLSAFIITLMVTFLSIFSNKIIENIKYSLNKTDYQFQNVEKIMGDLSFYLFSLENYIEGFKQKMTNKTCLQFIASDYNNGITAIRKNQYMNYALLKKFWNEDYVREYKQIVNLIKGIDQEIHSLNPEIEKILQDHSDKMKIPLVKYEKILYNTENMGNKLKERVNYFFEKMIGDL